MEKIEASIDNLVITSTKFDNTKIPEFGIKDFNNLETADRKLIVNNKLEFWVHDDALMNYSDYFSELFEKGSISDSVNMSTNINIEYKKSEISIPNEHMFFDILLWIYTRDAKKLKKAAKTFHNFLFLISLGIQLKMKSEFFEILLNQPMFDCNLEYFNEAIWSKTIFTFPILETIVEQMKTDNLTKIIALLSWLKEIDTVTNKIIYTEEVQDHILSSNDLFLVRNYILRQNLMSGLKSKDITNLIKKFPNLHSAFDTATIIDEFVYADNKKMKCLICRKEFNSPFDIINELECKVEFFHPKNIVNLKENKIICPHEGCGKKLIRNEYPCCHRGGNNLGCTFSEMRHQIIFIE